MQSAVKTTMVGTTRRLLLTGLAACLCSPAGAVDAPAPAAQTVVVFGDSQAQGLAGALQRASRHMTGIYIQNRTRPGTAISQLRNYDWQAGIAAYVPDPTVKIAVLMFGGNDRLPMRTEAGAMLPFRGTAWHDVYRGRAAAMLHSLTSHGLRVIWVSEPICREAHYSADMAYLNGIFQDVVAGSGASYLDIWTAVADSTGAYAAYGPTLDGATARLRLDDGIHFTPSGYDILAARVMQAIVTPTHGPANGAPR
jgi:hypothetical protein